MSSSEGQHRKKRGKGDKGGSSAKKGRPSVTSAPPSANRSSITSVPWSADRKHITQAAVKQSLLGGEFIDTKFYAFSRRSVAGVVDTPKPVFANSAVLKVSSKYFEGCESESAAALVSYADLLPPVLAGGYKEATISALDGPLPEGGSMTGDEYDYFSDSDLDDEEVQMGTSDPVEDTAEVGHYKSFSN